MGSTRWKESLSLSLCVDGHWSFTYRIPYSYTCYLFYYRFFNHITQLTECNLDSISLHLWGGLLNQHNFWIINFKLYTFATCGKFFRLDQDSANIEYFCCLFAMENVLSIFVTIWPYSIDWKWNTFR